MKKFISALITIIFTIIVIIVTHFNLKNINMVESLKNVEQLWRLYEKTYNLNNISSEDNIVLNVVRNEFCCLMCLKFGNVLIRSIIRIKRNLES